MTLLERYQSRRKIWEMEISDRRFRESDLIKLQELDYRISVMCTVQSLLAAVREDMELPALAWHYQVITAFFDQVVKERKFGPGMDAAQIQKRDEALAELEQTIWEKKEWFRGKDPRTAPDYKNGMGQWYGAVLHAWLRYRDSYLQIPT